MPEHADAQSTTQPSLWPAPLATEPVIGTVRVPGSKSITNRALILAALSAGQSEIRNVLISRDSQLMVDGLRTLGVTIEQPTPGVAAISPGQITGAVSVDCGLSGTMMRFVPPLSALADGSVTFDGDEGARKRPTAPTVDALRQLGVAVAHAGPGSMPFTVNATGHVAKSDVTIDASSSSQFVSGLLLSASQFTHGLHLTHCGSPLPSIPHINMTVAMLRAAGAHIEEDLSDLTNAHWHVTPAALDVGTLTIEPDLSNAAAFLAASMVTAGSVSIPDWPAHTTQAGDEIRSIFDAMGGRHDITDGVLTVHGPDVLLGADVDLRNVGELTPTVAAVACAATTRSRLTGIAHLRGHETDRLAALVTEINRLGGQASELPDGLEIRPRPLAGTAVHTYHDHRMATFAAIIGLTTPSVEVENISTTSKTMPDFANMWNELVA